MAAKRRHVRPLLILQALSLVVLSVVVAAFAWQGTSTYQAEVQAPRMLLGKARAAGRVVGTRPYLHLATGDVLYAEQAQAGITSLRAQLSALTSLHVLPKKPLQVSDEALRVIEESVAHILTAEPEADLSGALEGLARGTAALDTSLSTLEARIEEGINDRYRTALERLLLVWVAMLVVVLVTALISVRRDRANADDQQRLLRQLDRELARVLEEAASPAAPDAPVPDVPRITFGGVESLVASSRKVVAALADLRQQNERIQRSSSFTRNLIDALAMAETETEVLATCARAARSAYPEAGYQLLLSNFEDGAMRAFDESPEPACTIKTVEDCPAIRKGSTLHSTTGDGLVRCPKLLDGAGCVSCSPVLMGGGTLGVSQLGGYDPKLTQLDDLEALGLALAARLGVVRSLAQSEEQAVTDHLTKLANRRLLSDRLAALDRADRPYTVIVADLDHFKAINDQHGHEAGDRCLELFAKILRDASRGSDVPCRYGGEEFVILLPEVGMRAGLSVAMRIRIMLRDAIRTAEVPFTVSMGIATRPEHGESHEDIMRAADAALYDAKESGRDQVIPAPPPEMVL